KPLRISRNAGAGRMPDRPPFPETAKLLLDKRRFEGRMHDGSTREPVCPQLAATPERARLGGRSSRSDLGSYWLAVAAGLPKGRPTPGCMLIPTSRLAS